MISRGERRWLGPGRRGWGHTSAHGGTRLATAVVVRLPDRVFADLCHRGAGLSRCILVVGVVPQSAERIPSDDDTFGVDARFSAELDQPSAAVDGNSALRQ